MYVLERPVPAPAAASAAMKMPSITIASSPVPPSAQAAGPPVLWHAHEMIYGFAVAVVVGFLMTAGKAWTGLPTPRGPALGALAALWIAARCAALAAPYAVYAVLDFALLPLVAAIFGRVLLRAGNHRNLP